MKKWVNIRLCVISKSPFSLTLTNNRFAIVWINVNKFCEQQQSSKYTFNWNVYDCIVCITSSSSSSLPTFSKLRSFQIVGTQYSFNSNSKYLSYLCHQFDLTERVNVNVEKIDESQHWHRTDTAQQSNCVDFHHLKCRKQFLFSFTAPARSALINATWTHTQLLLSQTKQKRI